MVVLLDMVLMNVVDIEEKGHAVNGNRARFQIAGEKEAVDNTTKVDFLYDGRKLSAVDHNAMWKET